MPDTVIIELACLSLEEGIETLNFFCEIAVVALEVFKLGFSLAISVDVILELADNIFQLLILFYLITTSVFCSFLLLL